MNTLYKDPHSSNLNVCVLGQVRQKVFNLTEHVLFSVWGWVVVVVLPSAARSWLFHTTLFWSDSPFFNSTEVCMYVCMYVWMDGWMCQICMYVCMYVSDMDGCMYV